MALVRTCLLVVVLTGLGSDVRLEGSAGTIEEVPFELYQHHVIVVKGSIGRLNNVSLLIDTGTIPSVVDERIARKLRLTTESATLIAFGQQVSVRSAVLEGFRIGAWQSGPYQPASAISRTWKASASMRSSGSTCLARASLGIGYKTRRLSFGPVGREDSVAPLEAVWPFVTVRMTIAGQPVRVLVDTGSSDLVLFKTRIPAALADAPWRGDKTVQYASGPARLRLRQASLGAHVWNNLLAWALDRVPQGYPSSIDGVLGVRALGCQRVAFDFERNEFRWSK
jgi:Aspartyl protease